eukprot:Awhi_evm1s14405
MRKHSRENFFPCTFGQCRKFFNEEINLKAHLKCHTVDNENAIANDHANENEHKTENESVDGNGKENENENGTNETTPSHSISHSQAVSRESGNELHTTKLTSKQQLQEGMAESIENQTGGMKNDGQCDLETENHNHPFVCSYCGKSFKWDGALQSHLLIHTKKKPFQCTECGTSFNQNGNLKRHMQVHTKEKLFLCPFGDCGRSYGTKVNLNYHLLSHSEEKLFHCTFKNCGKAFDQNVKLLTHLQTHENKRKKNSFFICSIDACSKAFRQKGNLQRHMRLLHSTTATATTPIATKTSPATTTKLTPALATTIASSASPTKTTATATTVSTATAASVPLVVSPSPSQQTTCLSKKDSDDNSFICSFEQCRKSFSRQIYLQMHMEGHNSASAVKKKPNSLSIRSNKHSLSPANNIKTTNLNKGSPCVRSLSPLSNHFSDHLKYNLRMRNETQENDSSIESFSQNVVESGNENEIEKYISITNDKNRRFLCSFEDCGKSFRQKGNLKRHLSNIHAEQ